MTGIDYHKILESFVYSEKNPLLFNSGVFLFFFCFFLMGYALFFKTSKARIYFLTLFSLYFFYKACNWYVGFIILAAVVDFKLSNLIYLMPEGLKRKLLLWTSIFLNLLLLFTFKIVGICPANVFAPASIIPSGAAYPFNPASIAS